MVTIVNHDVPFYQNVYNFFFCGCAGGGGGGEGYDYGL